MTAAIHRPPGQHSPAPGYLRLSGLIILVVTASILAANYFVDPYVMHQWDSALVHRLQPSREKLSPWGKTYAVAKYRPQVLYLGNSRTELGLPADPAIFDGKRVFNGAISGGSLGDAIAMSQHARVVAGPEIVVWGIDYPSFTLDNGNTEFDRDLVATSKYYLVQRVILDLKRSLSFDMTADTAGLLANRREEVCKPSLAFHGQRDEVCVTANLRDRGGIEKALITDVRSVGVRRRLAASAFAAFDAELAALCRSNTRVVIYVNPLHALAAESIYKAAGVDAVEQWLTEVTQSVDAQLANGCNATLFDFSGFNIVTSETIPQVSGKPDMQNFWEGSHHRTAVGRKMLSRALSRPEPSSAADFGVQVSGDTLAAHLLQFRTTREAYRTTHLAEIQLLEKWLATTGAAARP
jgi:hypothetical protein